MRVELTVNRRPVAVETFGLARLLDVLREELALTGTKEGCGEGECGACSVLLDGELVNACLVPMAQVEGREVLTVEGVALDERTLHPLQDAMEGSGGAQCGICTPGMIMAGYRFLADARRDGARPTELDIRRAISGNLCRCTGYVKIVDALAQALAQSDEAAG